MTSHLSDESFAEFLAGEGSSESLAHLAACERCRIEAERISGALGEYKTQSLAWASQRGERQPARAGGGLGVLLAFPHSWRAAAAVVLACAVAGGVYRLSDRGTAALHEHAAGSLTDDNQLLLSIDQELSAQDPSPREVYARTDAVDRTNGNGAVVRE